ncbi:NADH dehydrogenase [ubiquinone] iron-sulfur protein 5 isoform X1 [Takifugu rubripes]|uniref:NADH dehydrogenase [ubiquinone] iron-sulfur protein 5 n=2 Tax=Takifugu TaxID=31032 RepID=H2SW16_TAKRU|nr:NADH dehydrogenase [ubiquinone] iron-sulfur protein 5 isoform X1 [Takifugu rubripes]XP_056892516.1 NADH dehydrogenase [ubiquinone] iron-sulfur protein 5 isoform X1 [Takifugu flavidus]TWW59909.1 NADH dehydrogenase [ubiquinone] iron-sulfur protein 5 [Takifugu flavidus]
MIPSHCERYVLLNTKWQCRTLVGFLFFFYDVVFCGGCRKAILGRRRKVKQNHTEPGKTCIIMPFVDLNKRFGFNLDHWILLQSGPQPHQRAARCHAFEKEWIECAHGIGQTRAKKECKLEFEDFYECMHRQKTLKRLRVIREQRDKLVKEGTYTAPPCHTGSGDQSP